MSFAIKTPVILGEPFTFPDLQFLLVKNQNDINLIYRTLLRSNEDVCFSALQIELIICELLLLSTYSCLFQEESSTIIKNN